VDANIRCMRGEKRGSASNKKRISMYSSRHVFISTRRDAHNGFKKAPCARLHSLCAVFLFRVIKSCFPRKIDRERERGGASSPSREDGPRRAGDLARYPREQPRAYNGVCP